MKQAVWAEEMLVSVVASVSGLKVQWLVVCDGSLVVRSCLPPLTSFPRDRTTI